MADPMDISALLADGELDREVIENLKNADRDALKRSLEKNLPDPLVARILERIDKLIAASDP